MILDDALTLYARSLAPSPQRRFPGINNTSGKREHANNASISPHRKMPTPRRPPRRRSTHREERDFSRQREEYAHYEPENEEWDAERLKSKIIEHMK